MILSDREIQLAIQRGLISVTEPPGAEMYDSTAVDLRLDAELSIWGEIKGDPGVGFVPCFCPGEAGFNVTRFISQFTRPHDLKNNGPYRIPPRCDKPWEGFVLGWTREKLKIPHGSRICARVEGKSSLARIGLGVHVTAPTVHAGFGTGKDAQGDALRLEIWNVGPLPIELRYEMRICQLIFEEVHGVPLKGYGGQFLDQGPKPPT
jgi:dCTP deaminase